MVNFGVYILSFILVCVIGAALFSIICCIIMRQVHLIIKALIVSKNQQAIDRFLKDYNMAVPNWAIANYRILY